MGLKETLQKRLFGFTSDELAQGFADLATANIYKFLGKDTEVSIQSNYDFIVNGYMSSPYAFEAINMIMTKIAMCPPVIYEVKSETKMKQYDNLMKAGDVASRAKAMTIKSDAFVEVDVPRIRKLLDKPNDKQSWDDFIKLLSVLLLATGNSLVYGVSGDKRTQKKSEIWALPFNPLQYSIVSGGVFDPVKSYRVNANAGNIKLDFEAEDILHIKTVNPLWETSATQLYGMAPLTAYKAKLMRSKLGDEATNKILKNGFKMGLISPKHKEDAFGDEQKKGLKEAIISALGSNESYRRFMPTSIGMDYTPIGLDSTELGVLELNKSDREDVYRAYNINPLLASTDNSSYNNMKEARKAFIYDAVVPWLTLIEDCLTSFICDPFQKVDGKKYIIRIDFMSLPELSADMKEMVEWLDKMPITSNEFREALGYGRSEEQGADAILINKSKVKLNSTTNDSSNNNE